MSATKIWLYCIEKKPQIVSWAKIMMNLLVLKKCLTTSSAMRIFYEWAPICAYKDSHAHTQGA